MKKGKATVMLLAIAFLSLGLFTQCESNDLEVLGKTEALSKEAEKELTLDLSNINFDFNLDMPYNNDVVYAFDLKTAEDKVKVMAKINAIEKDFKTFLEEDPLEAIIYKIEIKKNRVFIKSFEFIGEGSGQIHDNQLAARWKCP